MYLITVENHHVFGLKINRLKKVICEAGANTCKCKCRTELNGGQ